MSSIIAFKRRPTLTFSTYATDISYLFHKKVINNFIDVHEQEQNNVY